MRNPIATVVLFLLAVSIFCDGTTHAYNVLMATMGGTKSHTIPFVALGISLKTRGHNVTLLSAFPGPAANNGLQEFVPPIFEVTSQFFTPYVPRHSASLNEKNFHAPKLTILNSGNIPIIIVSLCSNRSIIFLCMRYIYIYMYVWGIVSR